MKYSDEQRVQKILEYSQKLIDYINANEITKDKLMTEYSLQWLVTTPLYNIGEHAYSLSKEYKDDCKPLKRTHPTKKPYTTKSATAEKQQCSLFLEFYH